MAEKIQIISTPPQSQPEKAEAPVQNATEQPPAQPVTEGASAPPNPATATVAPAVATSEKAATTQTWEFLRISSTVFGEALVLN